MTVTREAGELCGLCGVLPFGPVKTGLPTSLRFGQIASLRSAKSATPRMLGNAARTPFQKQSTYSSEVFGCPSTSPGHAKLPQTGAEPVKLLPATVGRLAK